MNSTTPPLAGQVEVTLKGNMALVTTFGLTPHGDRNEMMSIEEARQLHPEFFDLQLAGD